MANNEFVNSYVDGDDLICLSRREDGTVVTSSERCRYSSYYRTDDIAPGLRDALKRSNAVVGYRQDRGWDRIDWRDHWTRRDVNDGKVPYLVGIPSFEADVQPRARWAIDVGLKVQRPRRAYFDIETRYIPGQPKEEALMVAYAIVDIHGNRQVDCLDDDTPAGERALLQRMWQRLRPFDQIVAWGADKSDMGTGFDFPVIWARSLLHKIAVKAKRWLYLDHLQVFERMNNAESGAEKVSMKLQRIAEAILGEGKEDFDGRRAYEAWKEGGDARARMLTYCGKDADLLRRIEEKTGHLTLFETLCEVCGIFPETSSLNPTRQMDGYMLKLGEQEGHHFPTRNFQERPQQEGKYKGAYVMHPETQGIERNVHVVDFASMYPSIIITWNMSPDTLVDPVAEPTDAVCVTPKTGVCFDTTVQGLLPRALGGMLALRKEWTARKASFPPGTTEWHDADQRSTAYKVAANAFYGVLGNQYSRFHNRSIAESVTQAGVWLIEQTIAAAKDRGWRTIYGDTDSIFVTGVTSQEFGQFAGWCNTDLYPRILKQQGCRTNRVKIAYEKEFARIVLVSAKRYVGSYVHYKGKAASSDSKPEIKGLIYKRADATRLAYQLQARVIDGLVGGLKLSGDHPVPADDVEFYVKIVEDVQRHVLYGQLVQEDVVVAKALGKPIDQYGGLRVDGKAGVIPAHVRIALKMREQGEELGEGAKVEFVVTDGSVSPQQVDLASEWHRADRFYLWEQQVWPPTEGLLSSAFPGVDWKGRFARVRPRVTRARNKP